MIDTSEDTLIDEVAGRLSRAYPSVPPETVTAVVRATHMIFDGRPVRDFVRLLVERRANGELAKLAN